MPYPPEISTCAADWLDSLTEEQRDKLQEFLQHVMDEILAPYYKLRDKLDEELSKYADARQLITDQIDRIFDITGLLPFPGLCPQIDAELTGLLYDTSVAMQAQLDPLDNKISAVQDKRSEIDNKIVDTENRILSATDWKFWI